MMVRLQRGSSLIELLIALFVGGLVAGGAFLCVHQFQRTADILTGLHDRDGTLVVAPLLLVRWTAGAGCEWEGPPPDVTIEGEVLEIRADLDGPGGFPDGALDSPFESIAVRSARYSLQLRSGFGNFQPVLNGVESVEFSLATPALLGIDLRAFAPARLGTDPPAVDARCEVHLWNRRAQLF